MKHDLEAYLQECRDRFECFTQPCLIGWVDEVDPDLPNYLCWAESAFPTKETPTYVISISSKLKRAPKYVIRYLVLHEVLHILHPPRKGVWHHRAFRIAEQSCPYYVKANQWLHAFAKKIGEPIDPPPKHTAFYRQVIAPMNG